MYLSAPFQLLQNGMKYKCILCSAQAMIKPAYSWSAFTQVMAWCHHPSTIADLCSIRCFETALKIYLWSLDVDRNMYLNVCFNVTCTFSPRLKHHRNVNLPGMSNDIKFCVMRWVICYLIFTFSEKTKRNHFHFNDTNDAIWWRVKTDRGSFH